MQPDWTARAIGIAAVAIALADIVVTWWLWTKSGPRMRVRIRLVKHPSDRFKDKVVVEVANVGRMPVRVKEVGLEDRVSTGGAGSNRTTSYLSLPLSPSDGGVLSRVLAHTDLPLVAEAEMPQIINRWAPGRRLTLVGWVTDGNDRKRMSRELRFSTPRWPV